MAEGLARKMLSPRLIMSAGSKATEVNPFAMKALEEENISATDHYSKSVDDIAREDVSIVITLCAEEVCPVYLGHAERLHWPFTDPAAVQGSDEEILSSFRTIRDQIKDRINSHFLAGN